MRPSPSLVAKQMKEAQKLVRWGEVKLTLTETGEFLAHAFQTSHEANAKVVERIKAGSLAVDAERFIQEVEKEHSTPIAIGKGRNPEAALDELLQKLRKQ